MEIFNTIDTFKPSFFNASNNPYKDDKLYLLLAEDFHKTEMTESSTFKFLLSQRGEIFGQFEDVYCTLTSQYLHMFVDKNFENYIGS